MNKLSKAALAVLLAFSMTAPAFAAPEDTRETESNQKAAASGTEVTVESTIAPDSTKAPAQAKASGSKRNSYSFSDISAPQYAWAAPSIEEMSSEGYINGYEDGTFRPDNDVTRLEGLSLFSRAMGCNNEINEPIVSMAMEEYEDTLTRYSLSWGKDEIAYLLYKGALVKEDLDKYLKGSEKDAAMKRCEAAIIITKALGGEKAALAEQGIVLDYTDAKLIPNDAIQYVSYVSEADIMRGMEDGSFSPNTPVMRSQMAVMLERVVKAADYSFVKAKLVEVGTDSKNVVSKTADGKEKTDMYTDDTVMRVAGTVTQPKNMIVGVNAILAYSGSRLSSIDTLSSVPDETVTGKFVSYSNTAGNFNITILPVGKSDNVTYACASDITIQHDGSRASINDFKRDDFVDVELVDGKIASISGTDKTTTVKGLTVEEVKIEETALTMRVSSGDDEYDGKVFDISSTVSVTKNGKKTDMSEIYSGDTVTVTFQYGIVSKIEATSRTLTVEGNIVSITISNSPSMTVNVKGEEKKYDIPNGCDITINGSDGTLYDFRVGDKVTITTESNAITKIKAETTQISSGVVTGLVTAINTSYGFINVMPDGSSVAQTVYCKDAKTKFITTGGTSKKLSDVTVGMTVTANGTVSDGAFSATLVVIQE